MQVGDSRIIVVQAVQHRGSDDGTHGKRITLLIVFRYLLLDALMRVSLVVTLDILSHQTMQLVAMQDARHSRFRLPMKRSQTAFARGERLGVLIALMPVALSKAENEGPYFLSRSRMRSLGRLPQSVASRTCWVTHSSVGA